jgi:hypothetical protein
MYSEDTDIYGISIGNESNRKDVLPPLTKIDFMADSINYLASNYLCSRDLSLIFLN